MSDNKKAKKAKKAGIRRQRRRKVITGLNVFAAVLLMSVAVIFLNILAASLPWRIRLESRSSHTLSQRTLDLLRSLHTTIDVVAFLPEGGSDYDNVRALLREYAYEAARIDGLSFNLEIVNPARDLARTRELARKYDVDREDVVVFSCGGRKKYVEIKDLVQYSVELSRNGVSRKVVGFLGEQAFSSAILSVSRQKTPVVYFIKGHGEREPEDFGRQGGYSDIARIMRRDNMEVRTLQLSAKPGVPDDCAVLVIAGPDRKYSAEEVRLIGDYLRKRHGRLLVMIDPSVESGLAGMMKDWGVVLGNGVAAGLTLTGHELVVKDFGNHPITRSFKNMNVMFYMPRPILKAKHIDSGRAADRVKVTELAVTDDQGWIETNLSQEPPRYDKGKDHPGPVSVAVAVEKGAELKPDVEISPTRLVIIGDSYFVSNAALKTGIGGNSDFFMSSLNWLVDRDALLRVSPRLPAFLNPGLSRDGWRQLFLVMVLMVPGLIALLGLSVWIVRRR